MDKERNLGIDILCCIGVMLLLGLQYIHAAGFSSVPVADWTAIPTLAARCFCQSGAMVLSAGTGYILSRKKFSAGYFKIFVRLIYIYVVCSILALFLRSAVLDEFLSHAQEIQAVIQFSATETSRFAAMYFGLLLAAPFVNASLHGLASRKERFCFFGIIALCTLQPMLYISDTYLLSEWCKGLFPLAAYLGGALIQKYSKRKHGSLVTLIMVAVWICETLIVYDSSLKRGELYCPWLNSIAAMPNLCIALCLLELFHSEKTGDSSLHRFFAGAASGALAALLLGDPVINIMMPSLRERIPDLIPRLWAGYLVVPIAFILSCTAGLILQIPYQGVKNFLHNEEDEEDEEEEEPMTEPEKESNLVLPPPPQPVQIIPEKVAPKKKNPKPKDSPPTEQPRKKAVRKTETVKQKSPQNPPKDSPPKEQKPPTKKAPTKSDAPEKPASHKKQSSTPHQPKSSQNQPSKKTSAPKETKSAEPPKKHYEIHIDEESTTVPRRILTQPAALPVLKHAGKPVEKKEEEPQPPRKTADEIVGIYDTSTLNGLMEALKQRKDDSE